ncbi:MAG: hypothetical protein ABIN91_16775 [Mucilaginibacter sp.]|uniref:hypothetical protein n=1 Tax=Mucilaginibacter sp. TaxID=1882438 RepID=UPI003267D3D5
MLICVFLSFNVFKASAQDERITVLNKGIIGKPFIFDKSKGKDHDKTTLKYLGKLTTKPGVTYKIMSSCWIWGLSQRTTSRILVYTAQNKYIGNYYMSTTDVLPVKIARNQLIFKDVNGVSDSINFNNGVPKYIIVNGDDASFDRE